MAAIKKPPIELGSTVRDTLTPFDGVVFARAEYLYGCVQIGVQPTVLKDGSPLKLVWLDEPQLVVTEAPKPARRRLQAGAASSNHGPQGEDTPPSDRDTPGG